MALPVAAATPLTFCLEMKKRILFGSVALLFIVFAPIVPVPKSKSAWSPAVFEAKKDEIERATDKINAWTSRLRSQPAYKDIETFNLICKCESGTVFKSIAGLETGFRKTTEYAFGTWIIPTVPYLEYSEDSKAFLRPRNFEEFIHWVNERERYETLPDALQKSGTEHVGDSKPDPASS